MENETDVTENETDVTRAQMGETRDSLSEKLETLEQRMQGTANTVAQTVDDVHETVENVKDAMDLRLQVRRHPWAMMAGSIALGYLGGYLLIRRGTAQPRANGSSEPAPARSPSTEKQNGVFKEPRFQEEASEKKPVQGVAPAAAAPGWFDRLHNRFGAEIDKAEGLAIGMALGVVRDVITESAPTFLKAGLVDVIDGMTLKVGGEPLHGPVQPGGGSPGKA